MNIHAEATPTIFPNPIDIAGPSNLEKPKILALAHSTNLAGAQLALASLIKNTQEELEWSVVCPSNGPFVGKVEGLANTIVTDKYPWWCKGVGYTAQPTDFQVEKLNQVFDGIDYDFALTNTITVPWLAYNSRVRAKPHLWYIHEYGDLDHNLSFALQYDGTVDYINRLSDAIVTVSPSVGSHLLEHGAAASKIKYISQSFDVEDYLEIDTPSGENEILILGSIKESKGQLDALRGFAASSIRKSHILTIAGPVTDVQYAESIKQYIVQHKLEDRVMLVQERVDTIKYMERASIVMVCSRNEALGRVTLEALAAGRTVIGSMGGGTEMLLADARGLLYDGSIDDLTLRLNELDLATDMLMQSVVSRRQYVVDNFSAHNERDDFLDALVSAEKHHREGDTSRINEVLGKTGIFDAMRNAAIIA